MALPTTRNEFKEFCLKKLGKPAIDINVTDEQVEDRIDEALDYWHDYHYDGSRKVYLAHQVTADDKTNRYIPLDENVIGVTNIFDIGDSTSTNNLFNLRYQISLNDIFDTTNMQMSHFYIAFQHIELLEEILVGKVPLRFNRHTDRLYIDMDWNKVVIGEYIIVEGYESMDPETWSDVWRDKWLRNYATALVKRQWGQNLSKYEGLQLPGNVTFNGTDIKNEAQSEIEKMEDEMINKFSLPDQGMIG